MQIDNLTLTKWKALKSPADTKAMCDLLPGSAPVTFSRAFNLGKCNDKVFEIMATFYKAKAETLKQLL